jgi:hypothetical protein
VTQIKQNTESQETPRREEIDHAKWQLNIQLYILNCFFPELDKPLDQYMSRKAEKQILSFTGEIKKNIK